MVITPDFGPGNTSSILVIPTNFKFIIMVQIHRLLGWTIHPNDKVVNSLFKRIEKCDGECPCHHEEWDENTPHEDKVCPCITYRNGKGCHCGLYLKIKD